MNYKKTAELKPQNTKIKIISKVIATALIVAILGGLYLKFAWNRYQNMAESEALQLAQSVKSLLHVDHILALDPNEETQPGSAADFPIPSPTQASCEETVEINRIPFETGESILAQPISNPCGDWIRALVPIYDIDNKYVIAVLGLNYSMTEWQTNIWKGMVPDIIIIVCICILIFILFNHRHKHLMLKITSKDLTYQADSLRESERSKSVFFSHLPGMAYRCEFNENWTMEFVSDGCYILTGYKAESFVSKEGKSYNDIISPQYRDVVRAKWESVLSQHKHYRDEYEIITKSGDRRWVLELGQGIYDADGNVEALEGIVLDISDQKKKERQIAYLQERDFLTGLYNRKHIEQEKKRLDQPEFWPLSIAICDIDGLRMINDAYGYEEGDQLIAKVAGLIQGCLSSDYVLGYTGSGEFILLMPQTDNKAAHELESDIKNTIEGYNRANKNAPYAISITIGYSTKEKKDQQIDDVTKAAEKYLDGRKLLNQNSSHSSIVSSIMVTLYAKSHETERHGQRLGWLCQVIGEQLGLKQHPEIGHRIARTTPQLDHIAEYILHHHERWDGTGYPMGLKGSEIPLPSRILFIADAFDAMTEDRIYRKALPLKVAIEEIKQNAGKQFDPEIAKLFIELIENEKFKD